MRHVARGITLIEALMAAFLVLLVGGLTMTVIVNAKVLAVTTQDESQAALDLQASTWLLTRELTESATRYVTISTAPMGVAFPSARDASGRFQTDATGRPVWQKYVIYWVDDGLYRTEASIPVEGPLAPSFFRSLDRRNARRVSEGIRDLRAQLDPRRSHITLDVVWSGPTSQGKRDDAQMRFEVTLWN